jgi:hypothetical protein
MVGWPRRLWVPGDAVVSDSGGWQTVDGDGGGWRRQSLARAGGRNGV